MLNFVEHVGSEPLTMRIIENLHMERMIRSQHPAFKTPPEVFACVPRQRTSQITLAVKTEAALATNSSEQFSLHSRFVSAPRPFPR